MQAKIFIESSLSLLFHDVHIIYQHILRALPSESIRTPKPFSPPLIIVTVISCLDYCSSCLTSLPFFQSASITASKKKSDYLPPLKKILQGLAISLREESNSLVFRSPSSCVIWSCFTPYLISCCFPFCSTNLRIFAFGVPLPGCSLCTYPHACSSLRPSYFLSITFLVRPSLTYLP